MRRMDNRGFSLLELVIVVAIMAVLMGVLAPQFIKYVESSRERKDESLVGEIENVTRIASSAGEVYDALAAGDTTVVIREGAAVSSDVDELTAEIQKTFPSVIHFASKKYQNAGEMTVVVNIDVPRQMVIVTSSWN